MSGSTCDFCGDLEELEVSEVYPESRTFSIRACCEEAEAWALLEVEHADPKDLAAWIAEQTGHPVRRVLQDEEAGLHYGNGGYTLDYGLELCRVKRDAARAFCRRHHRHRGPGQDEHRPPCGWRWGHGLRNGSELVAVAMVGRPVARRIDPSTTVEVTRVCVDPRIPAALARNACSRLYGAAAREARSRGFSSAITYTLEDEAGASLRGAGWVPEATTKGGSWDRPSRRRDDAGPTGRKIRWRKTLAT